MAVNEEGKYTKLEDKTVRLLEEAFAMDCSITEACLNADISRETYYNWIKKCPEMEKRFDKLRETPFLKARRTINKGIEESYQNAMDYMKRKKKKEFGDNVDLTSDHKPLPIISLDTNAIHANNSDQQNNSAQEEN